LVSFIRDVGAMFVEAPSSLGTTGASDGGFNTNLRLRSQDLMARRPEVLRDPATGETPLHRAAGSGDAAEVRRLLRAGADPQALDRDGVMPLYRAAEAGSRDAVSALKRRGVPVDHFDRLGRTPLAAAAESGVSTNVARSLLQARACPDGAPYARDHGIEPPLITLCRQGDMDAVRQLLAGRAAPDTEASAAGVDGPATALQLAAASGSTDLTLVLVHAGASLNLAPAAAQRRPSEDTWVPTIEHRAAAAFIGRPPLLLAAERGHLRVVQALLHAAASPDTASSDGALSALAAASNAGHTQVVHELLRSGAVVRDGPVAAGSPQRRGRSNGRARPKGLAICLRREAVGTIVPRVAISHPGACQAP